MHELPVSRKELESLLKIIWWSSFPTKWSKARLWDCWLYPKQWFLCLCSIWLYHHNSRVTIYSSYQNKFDIFIWRLWTGKRLTCSYFDPYLCAYVCIFLSQPSIYIHMTYLHWKPPVLHSIHAVSGVKGQTWEYTSTCSGESKAFLLNPGCMWIRIKDRRIYIQPTYTQIPCTCTQTHTAFCTFWDDL